MVIDLRRGGKPDFQIWPILVPLYTSNSTIAHSDLHRSNWSLEYSMYKYIMINLPTQNCNK
ncbi:hypothetical protein L208DRAFT_1385699 [Tricholoma matsutake]|nr:hypothetical protein L208DRAFT_1385699 [Tricholoma matsutake 945]